MPIKYSELLKETNERCKSGKAYVEFYKSNKYGKIWNVSTGEIIGNELYLERGPYYFTFDKKKIYNFWTDFPQELTLDELRTFALEKPIMAKRLSDKEISKLMAEMTDEEKQNYKLFKKEEIRLLSETSIDDEENIFDE